MFITTLLLSTVILLGGCGESTSSNINNEQYSTSHIEDENIIEEDINELEEMDEYLQNSNDEESSTAFVQLLEEMAEYEKSKRFSFEHVDSDKYYDMHFSRVLTQFFVLTDNETNKQYLYIISYPKRGGCTSQIIEITE